jgi:chaperonin GroES
MSGLTDQPIFRARVSGAGNPKLDRSPVVTNRQGNGPFRGGYDEMNIRPLYDRILVRRVKEEEKTAGGLYIPDTAKEKPQEGKVVATGEGRRGDDGKLQKLTVKKGDRILFGKYSGSEVTIDGTECLIMREDDVLGILE